MTFPEILEKLRVPFLRDGHHHCRPGWLQMDCPLCGRGSERWHMGYNLASRYLHCWRCGAVHIDTALEAWGMAHKAARAVGRDIEAEEGVQRERVRTALVEPQGLGPLLPAHRNYLEGRGFNPDQIISTWGVKGIGLARRLQWRLYIPVLYRGQIASWTTRAIGSNVAQRYISASAEEESINHKTLVYGRDLCHHSIVIVEGPTDAWAVGPGAGALFGITFSTAQVNELVRIPNRFVCFDSAPSAQAKALELVHQLACFPGTTQNVILDAKDPGSASSKEIRLLRQVAGL